MLFIALSFIKETVRYFWATSYYRSGNDKIITEKAQFC